MVQVSLSTDVIVRAIWLDFKGYNVNESRCRFRAPSFTLVRFVQDRLGVSLTFILAAFPRKPPNITDHRMVHNSLE